MRNLQKSNFDKKDTMYSCDECGHQVPQKNSLAKHKRIVHNGVKFSCSQCSYQTTTKGHFAEHQRAVHEGVKHPLSMQAMQLSSNFKGTSCSTPKGSK